MEFVKVWGDSFRYKQELCVSVQNSRRYINYTFDAEKVDTNVGNQTVSPQSVLHSDSSLGFCFLGKDIGECVS